MDRVLLLGRGGLTADPRPSCLGRCRASGPPSQVRPPSGEGPGREPQWLPQGPPGSGINREWGFPESSSGSAPWCHGPCRAVGTGRVSEGLCTTSLARSGALWQLGWDRAGGSQLRSPLEFSHCHQRSVCHPQKPVVQAAASLSGGSRASAPPCGLSTHAQLRPDPHLLQEALLLPAASTGWTPMMLSPQWGQDLALP